MKKNKKENLHEWYKTLKEDVKEAREKALNDNELIKLMEKQDYKVIHPEIFLKIHGGVR